MATQPTITDVQPPKVCADGDEFTVTGSGFIEDSVILLDGSPVPTTAAGNLNAFFAAGRALIEGRRALAGAAVLEVDLGGSDLPHLITADVNTTAVATTLGYRLIF